MTNSMIIVIDNGNATVYNDFNSLVEAEEQNIRAYLKQKDELQKNKEKECLRVNIEAAKKMRDEKMSQIKGIDADIAGMESRLRQLDI